MSATVATRAAYGEALAELGAEDERVVVLDADLSGSTKTAVFGKQYPERFFNFGVAEMNMMAAAAITTGAARRKPCETACRYWPCMSAIFFSVSLIPLLGRRCRGRRK